MCNQRYEETSPCPNLLVVISEPIKKKKNPSGLPSLQNTAAFTCGNYSGTEEEEKEGGIRGKRDGFT